MNDLTIYKNKQEGRVHVTSLSLSWILWSVTYGIHKAEGIGRRMKYQNASRERSILLNYIKAKSMSKSALGNAIFATFQKLNSLKEEDKLKRPWLRLELDVMKAVADEIR